MNQPIILAGLAGALSPDFKGGAAAFVTEVIDMDDCEQRWQPTWPPTHDDRACRITAAKTTLTTASAKHDLRKLTGADLVDLESTAFARLASTSGWNWGIVRGVSDSIETNLPSDIDTWIDENGRTSLLAVMTSIVLNPALLGDLARTRKTASTALQAVAQILTNAV